MTARDILQLRMLRVIQVQDHDDHSRIRADGQGLPKRCPACGDGNLRGHSRNKQEFMDVPIHGKRTPITGGVAHRLFRKS